MRLLVGLKIFSKLNPLDLSIILVKYIQNVKATYARENCIGLADSGTYFWPMHRCILDFCLFLGPSPPPPNGLKKNPLQSSHARDMITFIVM